ncbi:hypothetical protein FB561_6806 [Kribbella amoyensis]|uniref:Uncharacterized protein n=1 Tax=Kribbella amoyensis TaxID=996641 RepID=A0A561B9E6_9ACTN|nr:hypothetical protein [Kribbella amoyensis]TWD75368.1 hypothetical protein FB561_6806 [Kribbella amoyensis]
MKFEREKRESREVAKPPPEALHRVDGGGPWGPTQFDLPERGGNSQAILIVALVGTFVLLVIAGLWTLAYFKFT